MNVPVRLATLVIAAAICAAALPAAASAAKATPLQQAQKLCERQGGLFEETPAGYYCRPAAGFTPKQAAVARKMCFSQGGFATFVDHTPMYYVCLVRQPPPYDEACRDAAPPGTFSTTVDPRDNTIVWHCDWSSITNGQWVAAAGVLRDSCELVGGIWHGSWSASGRGDFMCETGTPAS